MQIHLDIAMDYTASNNENPISLHNLILVKKVKIIMKNQSIHMEVYSHFMIIINYFQFMALMELLRVQEIQVI